MHEADECAELGCQVAPGRPKCPEYAAAIDVVVQDADQIAAVDTFHHRKVRDIGD
jgi:hypothetical protein